MRLSALSAISIYASQTLCDVTSSKCPWEIDSDVSRKGGTGGGGLVHPKGKNSMAVSTHTELISQGHH